MKPSLIQLPKKRLAMRSLSVNRKSIGSESLKQHDRWTTETDAKRKKEIAEELSEAAIRNKIDVSLVEQFVWSDGSIAEPNRLFTDVRLGFFAHGGKFQLARW
jgi:hypothetical protein